MVFLVQVDITDRSVSDGEFNVLTVGVAVLADGPNEAALIAAQVVAGTEDEFCTGDRMIVATRIVI